jgi:hypothetical protein
MKIMGSMIPTGTVQRTPRFGIDNNGSNRIPLPELPSAPTTESLLRDIVQLGTINNGNVDGTRKEDIFGIKPHLFGFKPVTKS